MNLPNVLLVDDEPLVLKALARTLSGQFTIFQATSGPGGLEWLEKEMMAVILADQRMPGMTGDIFLERAREIQPEAVRILITGYADIEAVVKAVNAGGIYFYLEKPWEPDELRLVVENAAERFALMEENKRLIQRLKTANRSLVDENKLLQQTMESQYRFDHLIGSGPAMEGVFQLLRKVIPTSATVLIQGETGTGKELIARAIHFNSPRKEKPFQAQNCGALPDTLLESELFGHEKGAFTGAVARKQGLFEMTNGGTVFLDELSDTSPAFQQRLLRVIQEGEIRPLGGRRDIPVDVRIIAASSQDLLEAVRAGTFRDDLYYRLNVVPIAIPPLRERKEDIPELVNHFLQIYSTRMDKGRLEVEPAALELLQQYDYPGNVRELENLVQRAVVLAEANSVLTPASFSELNPTATAQPSGPLPTLRTATEALERQWIHRALAESGGNISQAAVTLGLSRLGLYKKLERLKISIKNYK
ncbi:MAG: sigma-54-dependent Fis family transcriptional regulator [FCB group bacterium]|nr:sigma-54-dependent Fis family transcriptional regulator [FCB group bacterium]